MGNLRDRDVGVLLELIAEANGFLDVDAFRHDILPSLRRAVPCAMATYNEIEPERRRVRFLIDPPEALARDGLEEVFAEAGMSNPLVAHYWRTRDTRAYRISDFLTLAELQERPIYTEIFEPLGVRYQIAFALPSHPSLVIGIALSADDADFSERDRELLNLARPHLLQAYRNAQIHTGLRARLASLEHGLDAAGEGVALVTASGAIDAISAGARRLLEQRFGGWGGQRGVLPDPIRRWVDERRRLKSGAAIEPLVVIGGDTALLVRLVPARLPSERDVLLFEERGDPIAAHALAGLGVTPRESEVLRLVALGADNRTIADELGLHVATVRKHLERIYAKLGVRSRTAAAVTAWASSDAVPMLDEPAPRPVRQMT